MGSIWLETLGHTFDQALDRLAEAIRECTGELWGSSMWTVEHPPPDQPFLRPDWARVTDPQERLALARRWVERRSAPWSVAWHALETFDYDLSGDFQPWAPPPPFAGHPHWRDLPALPVAWSPSQLLAYTEYCRKRARATLARLTDEQAARPLPPTHRYRGQPHARIITAIPAHTTEHAAQIRQFLAGAQVPPRG